MLGGLFSLRPMVISSILIRWFGFLKAVRLKPFRGAGKRAFWIWIVYQAIKGTLTTSLIWIPLMYAWFYSG